jgi:hypothetical protein
MGEVRFWVVIVMVEDNYHHLHQYQHHIQPIEEAEEGKEIFVDVSKRVVVGRDQEVIRAVVVVAVVLVEIISMMIPHETIINSIILIRTII